MTWRVRHHKTFEALRARGTRVRSGPVRLTFVALDTAEPQVAFAFGRKFGSAVERNRARRRLRAAFRSVWHVGDPLGAYQLTGSRAVLSAPFETLEGSLRRCFDELGTRDRATPVGAAR